MGEARTVKLFKNGRNQAVRIPRDMELPGDEVRIEREGERLVLSPVDKPSLASLLRRWEAIDDDIGHVEDLPIDDIRL